MPAFTQNESGGFADTAVGHGSQAILEVAGGSLLLNQTGSFSSEK